MPASDLRESIVSFRGMVYAQNRGVLSRNAGTIHGLNRRPRRGWISGSVTKFRWYERFNFLLKSRWAELNFFSFWSAGVLESAKRSLRPFSVLRTTNSFHQRQQYRLYSVFIDIDYRESTEDGVFIEPLLRATSSSRKFVSLFCRYLMLLRGCVPLCL